MIHFLVFLTTFCCACAEMAVVLLLFLACSLYNFYGTTMTIKGRAKLSTIVYFGRFCQTFW